MKHFQNLFLIFCVVLLTACAKAYYSGLESIGIPKRDVMVHRVKSARDTQEQTKKQFKSALEQFTAITRFQGGDLEVLYKRLNAKYQDSVDQAEEVKSRIEDIESVSEALFEEWQQELNQYSSASLRRSSADKLRQTKAHYRQLIAAMKRAEAKINPVLTVFNDQVLYLKHNLNARAIAALKGELNAVEADVSALILAMEDSINEANAFIKTMQQ